MCLINQDASSSSIRPDGIFSWRQTQTTMAHASFNRLRVLSLESRRATEIAKLIRTYDGEPLVVPSMREVSASSNKQVFEFAEGLLQSRFDLVVFLTGVGVRTLLNVVETKYDRESFL